MPCFHFFPKSLLTKFSKSFVDVKLNNRNRLNNKMSQRDKINRNGTKGDSTLKQQSIPIIDLEVRDDSPPALTSTLVITGKGFKAPRKSPSKKLQNKTIGDARELDTLYQATSIPREPIPVVYTDNWISGFEERTPSPVMDLESRTSTPTECLSEPVKATNQKLTSTNVDYTVTRPKEPTNLKKGYGISLDMVELWEGESDNESGSRDDKFDSINGVIINPRKTIDFSELRRFRLKEAADVDEKAEKDHDKRRTSKKANRAKPKVMMTKNMKALLTFPPASPRSTDYPPNVTFEKYCRNLKSSERETRKEEHQQHQQQRTKPLPILTKPGKKPSREGTESPSISKPRSRGSPLLPPKQRQLNVTYDLSDELAVRLREWILTILLLLKMVKWALLRCWNHQTTASSLLNNGIWDKKDLALTFRGILTTVPHPYDHSRLVLAGGGRYGLIVHSWEAGDWSTVQWSGESPVYGWGEREVNSYIVQGQLFRGRVDQQFMVW